MDTYGQDAEDPDTFWYLFKDNGKLYMPSSVSSTTAYELDTDEDTEITSLVIDTDSDLTALYNYKVGANYYAFNKNGMIQVANDDKYEQKDVTIDGTVYTFIVNSKGKVQLSDEAYEDGDDVLFGGATFTYDEESKKSATYGSIAD